MNQVDEEDTDLDEEKPLTEEDRIRLINETIEHKDDLESIPILSGFYSYLLHTIMNRECLKCVRSKPNLGNCYGKVGGNPCLIFKG